MEDVNTLMKDEIVVVKLVSRETCVGVFQGNTDGVIALGDPAKAEFEISPDGTPIIYFLDWNPVSADPYVLFDMEHVISINHVKPSIADYYSKKYSAKAAESLREPSQDQLEELFNSFKNNSKLN